MKTTPLAFAALLAATLPVAAQDVAAGEKSFAKCRACHQIGETAKNSVGPVLNGLIGRPAGTVEGYNYSVANKNSGLTWDEATFSEYIASPATKIKGTKMAFAGIKDPAEVANLVAYLTPFDSSGTKQ